MEAIIRRMPTGEDWMLGDDLQVARKELQEVKEWLLAIQKKNVRPSPHPEMPTRPEPTSPPKAPRGQLEVSDQGNTVKNEADAGKVTTPPQSMG